MAAVQRLACPVFTGDRYDPMAARAFLEEYENYATAYNMDNAAKLQTLSSALRDQAREWFLSYKRLNDEPTWAAAREAFARHFTAPVPRVNRAAMAADCKQRPAEDVRTFLTRCMNLSFETFLPPRPAVFPTFEITAQPPNVGNVAVPAMHIQFQLDQAQRTRVTRIFVIEQAINLFVAGVNDNIRKHLLLNQSWETWDELSRVAVGIEQTVMPSAIAKQTQHYASNPTAAINPVQQNPQHQNPAAINPINPANNRRKQKQQQQGQQPQRQQRNQQPQAPPDPNQQRSHNINIRCDYCHGTYHTKRHCLAKAKAEGRAPVAALQPATTPMPQQQPALAQQLYQETQQCIGYQQQQQPTAGLSALNTGTPAWGPAGDFQ